MKLPLLFARRYLSSKKSLSVINIISRVSSFAVGVPVAAMVILLSVFNGFEGLTEGLYNSFDADILVSPAEGKVFESEPVEASRLDEIEGVEAHSFVLEEGVLLEYGGNQLIATLRGVDSVYPRVIPVESLITGGEYELTFGEMQQAVVGQGIAYNMGIKTAFYTPVTVYAPRRGTVSTLLPMEAAKSDRLFPAGIFSLNADVDGRYVFSTIDFARELFDYSGLATAVAVKLSDGAEPEKVSRLISERLGDRFRVLTRHQQNASMFQIMKYEKWGVFFITFMVLVIASFSIIGSLVMLIIDKRENIRTLVTMGADVRLVRRIFVSEGFLIGMIGATAGFVLGVAFCLLQQHFGFIKMGGTTFLMDTYPVMLKWGDALGIVAATIAVNYIITKFTVSKMIPQSIIRL